MQAQDAKYKKWGWGALIGLGAVILIAGLIVAVSMSAPKKTTDADKANGPASTIADNTDNSDKKDDGREDNDKGDDADKNGTDGTDGADGTDGSSNNANSNNSNNSGNTNTNNASNMPKTGPEEDIASIVAWSAIAGLGAYYFLNAKNRA